MAGRILTDDGGRAFDTNGNPISGAKLKAFTAGTSNAVTLYTTRLLNVAHANPVVANSAGQFAQIWADEDQLLDIKLYASDDVTFVTPLRTFLNVTPQGPGVDNGLRGELANEASDLVVVDGQTLGEILAAQQAINERFSSRDLSPIVIPMHFGIMKGVGWNASDPGDGASQKGSTIVGSVVAGATTITVASGTNFVNGLQLIAYQGTDTEWYTTVVSSKSGTTLTLAEPAPAAASNGALIGAFFNDFNHPREYGSYAIADAILRNLTKKRRIAHVDRDYTRWGVYGSGPTLAAETTMDYQTPGSDLTGLQAVQVDTSTQFTGAQTLPVDLPAGNYEAVIAVNPGNVAGARNAILVFVEEEFEGTTTVVHYSVSVVGLDCCQLVTLPFNKSEKSRVRIYAQEQLSGSGTFKLGAVKYFRIMEQSLDLTSGTWVAIGDSWFANPFILDRIEDRLPNITLVRKGTSGNKIADINTRFDADVIPSAPRVVLSNLGSTNDYSAPTSLANYSYGVRTFTRRCQEIGAQAILLDATVGDVATSTQLRYARAYAAGLEYEESAEGDRQEIVSAQWAAPITIAAGAKQLLLISPFTTSRGFIRDYLSYAVSHADVFIEFGFTSNLTPPVGTLDNEIAVGGVTSAEVADPAFIARTPATTTRYIMVVAENTNGSSQTIDRFNIRLRGVRW